MDPPIDPLLSDQNVMWQAIEKIWVPGFGFLAGLLLSAICGQILSLTHSSSSRLVVAHKAERTNFVMENKSANADT